MTNKNLQDAHLKTALEHAPDNHVAPDARVRNTVLEYAKKTAQPRENWLERFKNWWLKDHFSQSNWASLAGLAAVFLVTVLIWRERPEDTTWITSEPASIPEAAESAAPSAAAAPKTIAPEQDKAVPEIATNEIAADAVAPAEDSARKQATSKAKVLGEINLRKDTEPLTEQPTFGRAEVAGQASTAAVPQKSLEEKAHRKIVADTTATNAPDEQNMANTGASVAASPPVAAPVAVAKADQPAEAARQQAPLDIAADHAINKNAELADSKENRGTLQESAVAQDKGQETIAESKLAPQDHDAVLSKRRALKAEGATAPSLNAKLLQLGGQTLAAQDRQSGKFRLLEILMLKKDHPQAACCTQACTDEQPVRYDEATHLPIEYVFVCEPSAALMRAVTQYNEAMRNALKK